MGMKLHISVLRRTTADGKVADPSGGQGDQTSASPSKKKDLLKLTCFLSATLHSLLSLSLSSSLILFSPLFTLSSSRPLFFSSLSLFSVPFSHFSFFFLSYFCHFLLFISFLFSPSFSSFFRFYFRELWLGWDVT